MSIEIINDPENKSTPDNENENNDRILNESGRVDNNKDQQNDEAQVEKNSKQDILETGESVIDEVTSTSDSPSEENTDREENKDEKPDETDVDAPLQDSSSDENKDVEEKTDPKQDETEIETLRQDDLEDDAKDISATDSEIKAAETNQTTESIQEDEPTSQSGSAEAQSADQAQEINTQDENEEKRQSIESDISEPNQTQSDESDISEKTDEVSDKTSEVNEKKSSRQKYFDDMFAELKEKIKSGETIEVEIKARIRGGLRVQYKDIPMFLPTSHYTLKRNPGEEEMQDALNNKIQVNVHEIQEFDEGRKAVIVSRKHLLLEDVWSKINVGDIVEGKVSSVATFGVFMEFEGIEGLIHISRLSKIHIDNPNRFFRKGQDIQAKIININKSKGKIALSRKELEASPWRGISEEIKPGTQIRGIVRRLTDFGTYIEIKPGVEGLLRNNELSWTKRIKKPSDILTPGQEISIEVLSINEEKENAALSFKRTQPNPWPEIAQKYSLGTEFEATIMQVIPQGAIVSITDELDGFMPRSKMRPVMKGKKIPYNSGDKLEVVIADLNPDEESLILAPKVDDNPRQERSSPHKPSQSKSKTPASSAFSFGDILTESELEKLKNMNDK